MKIEPLEETYFKWLQSAVRPRKTHRPEYWDLLRLMHSKEFVWFVPNDDNRIADGIELRHIFLERMKIDCNEDWLTMGCSMLEMFVGVAYRLAFHTADAMPKWFWELIFNVGLIDYMDLEEWIDSDEGYLTERRCHEILDAVIWRTYKPSGEGGLFPLKHAEKDQREVEIWYQMHAYLLEKY